MLLVRCMQMGLRKFLLNYPAQPLWIFFASRRVSLSGDENAFRTTKQGKLMEREESLRELIRRVGRVEGTIYSMGKHDEPFDIPPNNLAMEISHEEEASIDLLRQQNVSLSVEYIRHCQEKVKLLRNREIIIQEIKSLSKFDNITSKIFKEVYQVSAEGIHFRFEEMRNASQYFDLLEYLVEDFKIRPVLFEWQKLKQNTSSEEISISLQKLSDRFPHLKQYYLNHGVNVHIVRLHCLRMVDLIYELCLFLPSCEFLEPKSPTFNLTTLAEDVASLMQRDDFRRSFHELPDVYVEQALQKYKDFLVSTERFFDGKKLSEWRSTYEEDMKTYLKSRRNYHLQVKNPFADSIFEMVFQTRKEGCRMDVHGDPHQEVSKIEKYFEVIKRSQQQLKRWKKMMTDYCLYSKREKSDKFSFDENIDENSENASSLGDDDISRIADP